MSNIEIISNDEMQDKLQDNPREHPIILIRQDVAEERVRNLRFPFHIVIIRHAGELYEGMVQNYLKQKPRAMHSNYQDKIREKQDKKLLPVNAPFTDLSLIHISEPTRPY